jgi:hypothetical protein
MMTNEDPNNNSLEDDADEEVELRYDYDTNLGRWRKFEDSPKGTRQLAKLLGLNKH